MRPKKRSISVTPKLLIELASHAAMGVALGLVFALIVTHVAALGIATLISYSANPAAILSKFIGTCAITFGIGATLTGLVITLTEDDDACDIKLSLVGGRADFRWPIEARVRRDDPRWLL